MATNTPNLNLLKKDPVTDGNETFNVQTMLNDNWDKIDAAVGEMDIPDASLTVKGKVQLSNAIDGTREDVAATERAVKVVSDNVASYLATELELKAPVNNPIFTGIPKIGSNPVVHTGNISTYAPTPSFKQFETFDLGIIVDGATGNDSVDGGPYKTIQAAMNYLKTLSFRAGSVAVNIKPGIYNEDVSLDRWTGQRLAIVGLVTSSSKVMVKSMIFNNINCFFTVAQLQIGRHDSSMGNVYRCLRINECLNTMVYYCDFKALNSDNVKFNGIEVIRSRVIATGCSFNNCYIAMYAQDHSVAAISSSSGASNDIGYCAADSSILVVNEKTSSPMTATTLKSKSSGGVLLGPNTPTY